MKNHAFAWMLSFLMAAALLWTGCDECASVPDPMIGTQRFTVEYVTPGGVNYLNDIYNKANIVVYVDSMGGTLPSPRYRLLQPGFADGKFGPFFYTKDFVNSGTQQVNTVRLYGNLQRYDYFIKRDTFGLDKITVEYLIGPDECPARWRSIRYLRNDVHLPEYDLQQDASIRIVE